ADGKTVVVQNRQQYVLVEAEGDESPRLVTLPERSKDYFTTVRYALLPDSRRVVTVDGYGVIRVRDLKTGKQLDRYSRFPGFGGVQALDGHRAASWSHGGTVVVWDVRDGRVLSEADVTPNKNESFTGMELTRDGRYVVAWVDDEVRRRDCILAEAAT